MKTNTHIAIIDDHVLFLTGISEVIKKKFGSENIIFSSPQEFLENDNSSIDLLITDIEMGEISGIDLISNLREQKVKFPVLVITMHDKLSVIKKCRQLNVEGYLLKDDSNAEFLLAIKSLLNGQTYYSKKVLQTIENVTESDKTLSPREEEIIRCIVKGLDSNEIANKLFISPNTVKTHRKNIKNKLELNSTADIVNYAYKNLIIKEKP